jgi:hypothetical protein
MFGRTTGGARDTLYEEDAHRIGEGPVGSLSPSKPHRPGVALVDGLAVSVGVDEVVPHRLEGERAEQSGRGGSGERGAVRTPHPVPPGSAENALATGLYFESG